MDPNRFSTPSRVRSPVRGGVTASSRVAGWGLPLSIPVMKFHFMSAPPLGRAAARFWRRVDIRAAPAS